MPNWNHYLANINDHISSVYLDLSAKKSTIKEHYPTLCWLFIKLKVEKEDGLSHDDEFDILCEYDDAVEDLIVDSDVIYVGRITTNGMRQFYFYSQGPKPFEAYIEKVINSAPKYQNQLGQKDDPNWSQYDTVLYPGDSGLEQIAKRRESA